MIKVRGENIGENECDLEIGDKCLAIIQKKNATYKKKCLFGKY